MNVLLVGQADPQTDYLLGLMRRRLPVQCRLASVAGLPQEVPSDAVYVLDMAVLDVVRCSDLLSRLSALGWLRAVLINVAGKANHERLVALPGVCGLFLRGASADDIVRGVGAIMGGDYWLPRRVLCEHLEKTRHAFQSQGNGGGVHLTHKERQLLDMLAQGCTNDTIAHHLAISPHTVKSHFYNLYRKLRVHNRVQAVAWAQQHGDDMMGR